LPNEAQAPLFVLITARPEFRVPWGIRSHHSMISLSPLNRDQVQHMVRELAALHALPKEVIDGVTERTGGVPLFVEEVTRLLLERGEQNDIRAIPPTLQQSLMARLDRLGPAREVAQIGAVIGRDFPYALLRVVAGTDDAPLQAALDRLADADILLVQGLPPDADYRFKHALIQDAAYENLLRSRRQILHRRVGEVLRDHFTATAAAEPELLAHHFTQAGLIEDAIEWWGKAGQRSLARSALIEAIEQLTRARGLVAALPSTKAIRRNQINLQVSLANALMHTKGYASPETKAALSEARSLIEKAEALGDAPEDPLLLFSVLYGFWVVNFVAFNGDAVRDLAAQFLALAENQRATAPLLVAHRLMGSSLLTTGEDLVEGRTHLDKAIALYDRAEHSPLATRFGQDVGVVILSWRSRNAWVLGYPEAALVDAELAVKNAREIGHAPTLMYALFLASFTHTFCGSYAPARALADEFVTLADEIEGASFWKAQAMSYRSCLMALTDEAADAAQMITSALSTDQSTRTTLFVPWYSSTLATAYAKLGQFDDAWRCIREALTMVETTKERWCEAEVHRIAGEVALNSTQSDRAEADLERALTVARQQQAKSWELRASMSLARLWRDQGKVQPARELLAPAYGWFTEGFDTRDLKDAKALLEELAA
jgi:predicted ATPase